MSQKGSNSPTEQKNDESTETLRDNIPETSQEKNSAAHTAISSMIKSTTIAGGRMPSPRRPAVWGRTSVSIYVLVKSAKVVYLTIICSETCIFPQILDLYSTIICTGKVCYFDLLFSSLWLMWFTWTFYALFLGTNPGKEETAYGIHWHWLSWWVSNSLNILLKFLSSKSTNECTAECSMVQSLSTDAVI